jgi:hypothetical protein
VRACPAVQARLGERGARPDGETAGARERQPALQVAGQRLPRGARRGAGGVRGEDPDLAGVGQRLVAQGGEREQPDAHADRDRDAGRLQGLPAVARERHGRRGGRQRRDEHRHGGEDALSKRRIAPVAASLPRISAICGLISVGICRARSRRRGLQGGHQHLLDVGQLDPHVTVAAQQHTVRDHDALAHHPRELRVSTTASTAVITSGRVATRSGDRRSSSATTICSAITDLTASDRSASRERSAKASGSASSSLT